MLKKQSALTICTYLAKLIFNIVEFINDVAVLCIQYKSICIIILEKLFFIMMYDEITKVNYIFYYEYKNERLTKMKN